MRALVCGGAMSLIGDVKRAPKYDVMISASYHAAQSFDCDYVVYYHDVVKKILAHHPAVMIDVKTDKVPWFGFVGSAAVSFALLKLGASKIFMAGYGLYQGTPYFHESSVGHDGKAIKPPCGMRHELDAHLNIWQRYFYEIRSHIDKIEVLSGPLIGLLADFKQNPRLPIKRPA